MVSDDDIIMYVVKQMYVTNWFSEDHMTEWEECNDQNKTWEQCGAHFERCYIVRKWYHDANGAQIEEVNKINDYKLTT